MFSPPGMGYDRAITIFSPDGRLFQVEYAVETVRKGWTTVGIRAKDGVVLAVERKKISPLADPTSPEKIVKIDDHLGVAYAGLSSDARILIDRARVNSQINRLYYDEAIDTEVLTKRICDLKQLYTQHAGVRPFGVSFLVAGADKTGTQLFMTEPSGAYSGYQAVSIGSGSATVTEYFEKNYKAGMDTDGAIGFALKALNQVIEGGVDPARVEMAVIDNENQKFQRLSPDAIVKQIDKFKAAGG